MSARHQRLHLTQGGRFLGWDPGTRAEESFDLLAECQADREKPAGEILARHLADDGLVTADTFGMIGFENKFKPQERSLLESRAKEINGADTVDFSRVIRARWSLATPNRSQITVPNEAWDLEKFNGSNPIGAWNHRTSFSDASMIVARWLHTGHRTSSEKSELIGFEEFVPAEVNPMASTVLGLYRFGALNAFSPGFLIGSVDFENEDGVIFGSKEDPNELVELSNVPVPRHADAVMFAMRASGGELELGPIRELIKHQLEVAYTDPMQIMEAAQLEAWAEKLGIDRQRFVQMSSDDVEAYELPGYAEGVLEETEEHDPAADLVMANALRSRNPDGLDVDEDAWQRFMLATETDDGAALPDETLAIVARAAGLQRSPDALERVMALGLADEAGTEQKHIPGADVFEGKEENTAGDGEDGAEGAVSTEGKGFTAEAFGALFESRLKPIVDGVARTQGRLVIPAE